MYSLVRRVPQGMDQLKSLFETHVHQQGLTAIERCKDTAFNVSYSLIKRITEILNCPQDPRVYVNALLDGHRKYSSLVHDSFGGEQGFLVSLDKVL